MSDSWNKQKTDLPSNIKIEYQIKEDIGYVNMIILINLATYIP